MKTRWLQSLLAILVGNALYFAMERFLPAILQHQSYRIDAGFALDFLLCIGVYFTLGRWLFHSGSGAN